ncbi:MAG: DUF4097 family beta strand repeat protein [Clostridia bacterium]|nr:DUF4097 family beta strand repeat protein [Clostridia bacterium]
MNREQFLNALRKALQGMEPDEAESVIAYYSEMIDDRMEAGMSEEAAVKAMEPVKEIAGRVLEEGGFSDEKQRKESDAERQEIRRPAENIKEVFIQAEGKRVRIVSDDDADGVTLHYRIGNGDIFRLHEEEGVLMLEHKLRPVSSFVNERSDENVTLESIIGGIGRFLSSLGDRVASGGFFGNEAPENEIEVVLPRSFFGRLRVSTSNARISVGQLVCGQEVSLATSNGRITLEDIECTRGITCVTSNGRISLADVNAESAHLSTSNGRITLQDVFVHGMLEAHNSNGAIEAEDTGADQCLHLGTSNGRIAVEGISSPDIVLKTSNGAVTGKIRGQKQDYTVCSATSNGTNSLGSFPGGGKALRVNTSNASISVDFAAEE